MTTTEAIRIGQALRKTLRNEWDRNALEQLLKIAQRARLLEEISDEIKREMKYARAQTE